jgi:hypothetical protein
VVVEPEDAVGVAVVEPPVVAPQAEIRTPSIAIVISMGAMRHRFNINSPKLPIQSEIYIKTLPCTVLIHVNTARLTVTCIKLAL